MGKILIGLIVKIFVYFHVTFITVKSRTGKRCHGLWKIEETFRAMKSNLESRPCFVWTESRIKGRFVSCFIALTIQRIIEFRLREANCNAGTAQIIDAVRSANVRLWKKNRDKYLHTVNRIQRMIINMISLIIV